LVWAEEASLHQLNVKPFALLSHSEDLDDKNYM
jgi:hypothetical protein